MKAENLTRYICDICGKTEYARKDERPQMQEIRLPMKYYDETGRQHGLTNQRIDICPACFKTLESDLSEHYFMSSIAYVGVEIKRHDEKGGE